MKFFTIFFVIASLQLSAKINSQTVTLSLENATIQDVFKQINQQTGHSFFYKDALVRKAGKINIKVSEASIQEVMELCLGDMPIEFKIVENSIILKSAVKSINEVSSEQESVERIEIKGKITDRDGNPLPGATIMEAGTLNGTISNPDGIYSFTVSGPHSIVKITYVGFETQEITVGTQTIINVVLQSSATSLEDVVVIGYGTARKGSIGSAISQITAKEIEELSVGATSFEQILGGQIKGVEITQASGAPGAPAVIRVRGITSPFSSSTRNNNQPLYVIDGVAFNVDPEFDEGGYRGESQNPLLGINPNDIETFTVLKDAAATSIYGSRGANGVILITTKRGQKNSEIQTTLNYSLSLNNNSNKLDLLNAEGFKELHQMIAKNTLDAYALGNASITGYRLAEMIIDPTTGEPRETLLDLVSGRTIPVFGDANTDWQEEMYPKNAPTHQWNLSMRGGDASTNFSLGFSYTDQQPLVVNSSFKRYGARLGIDSEANSWLKIGTSLNYSGSRNSGPSSTSVLTMRPDYGVYDESRDFLRTPSPSYASPGVVRVRSWGANPVASLEAEDITYSTTFLGNAYTEARLFKGFKLRADVNAGVFKTLGRRFRPIRSQRVYSTTRSSLTNYVSENYNHSLNLHANYHRNIQKHNLELMSGASWDRVNYHRSSGLYAGLADDYILTNATSASAVLVSNEAKAGSGINSLYGRLQYSYDWKYTATVNFRRDKSSKFGPGNRVGYFPSLALNWNIHRETFMDELDWVDKLMARASYGKTGLANVADFAYMQYFEAGASRDREYEPGNIAITPTSTYPNTDIHWESTKEFNAGLDFSLFSGRLYASFDIYNKNTDGILIASPYPLESGAGSYTSNLAEISNKGWELEIGADIIRSKDFNWAVNFNIAANRNKIESMEGHSLTGWRSNLFIVGQPVGIIRGYRVEKIIQTQEEIDALNAASPTGIYFNQFTSPGDYLYKDLDGDGRVTSVGDQEVIGTTQPDYFGGFNMMLNYKRLSLTAGFQYSVGGSFRWGNSPLLNVTNFGVNALPEALTDTWTPENTTATYPRMVYGYHFNRRANDANLHDASYLRLKVLRFNYNIPEGLLHKLPLKSATLYASATNLFTWNPFKGSDPENGRHLLSTVNSDQYPYSRTFSFGIKVDF